MNSGLPGSQVSAATLDVASHAGRDHRHLALAVLDRIAVGVE
jgi:hypothetical protein